MVPTGGRRNATIASVQYGSEIGDHVSVGRDEPARTRILRDHRFAWSGRGKIARVEISTDGGTSWSLAALQEPVLPICQTRFRFPWIWNGKD
jgi:hypothetical protein